MWARGGVDTSEVHEDLKAFGAPPEVLEAATKLDVPKHFGVWPENWETVEMFMRMQTQWKVGAMGGVSGFDYSCLPVLFDIYAAKEKKDLFESIQIMEVAALKILNKKKVPNGR